MPDLVKATLLLAHGGPEQPITINRALVLYTLPQPSYTVVRMSGVSSDPKEVTLYINETEEEFCGNA